MKIRLFLLLLFTNFTFSQSKLEKIDEIVNEANNNSQLEILAHELMDQIGPRLTGTPQMMKAHDWAVNKYNSWGIKAENEQFGIWRGWERGISHMDMLYPWVKSLEGQQLSWSGSTKKNGVESEAVIIPPVNSKEEFDNWVKTIKGKHILVGPPEITGRPDYDLERWLTPESLEGIKNAQQDNQREYYKKLRKSGYGRNMMEVIENSKPASFITSGWRGGFGTNTIFSPGSYGISPNTPTVDLSVEDYGLLYRLAENGKKPIVNINIQSKELGKVPTFNTIAKIEGVEKPNEYIILSAHFDSTGGATGATDNGTGTIVMMESMRILKKLYPNPKRTIIAGHWGAEEQGLNGSSAFVEDHPEIVENLQALFNQDNGTGRVVKIEGHAFLNSYRFIGEWLNYVPENITKHIETVFPGLPIPGGRGGSDYFPFIAAGAPGYSLESLDLSYGARSEFHYTWHTNRDTYDKIIFDDVRSNVVLVSILTYLASEEDEFMPRDKVILPINPKTGKRAQWPKKRVPNRDGSEDN